MNRDCGCCGSELYEQRRTDYLYSHDGAYLLVPNTPVEVCSNCGMVYYAGPVLEEIERKFFAIQNATEQPDRYLQIPEASLT